MCACRPVCGYFAHQGQHTAELFCVVFTCNVAELCNVCSYAFVVFDMRRRRVMYRNVGVKTVKTVVSMKGRVNDPLHAYRLA